MVSNISQSSQLIGVTHSLPLLCPDSYTHSIEAVSCDEALIDVTDILAETKLSPEEFAAALRMEIKDKTDCAASVGIG